MTTTLTPLDTIRVEIATEQHLGRYLGGPLNLTPHSAARYVAEGNLGNLCDRYGLGVIWAAVNKVIQDRPEVATADDAQRRRWANARAQACVDADQRAGAAFLAGDFSAALAALADGEQADPDYRIGGATTWAELREYLMAHPHTPR